MKVRTDTMATQPAALKAMLALENYVNSTSLSLTRDKSNFPSLITAFSVISIVHSNQQPIGIPII